ncbi:hypothetical protein BUH_6219 [Burkholderia pseudomallei Pakistan 9]|nr:hypothetical protein BUH_6219 [Burkholderia pseudomallei Pakistan 9]
MKAAKRSSVAARSRVAGGGAPPAPHARTGSKRRAAAARRGTRMARQGGGCTPVHETTPRQWSPVHPRSAGFRRAAREARRRAHQGTSDDRVPPRRPHAARRPHAVARVAAGRHHPLRRSAARRRPSRAGGANAARRA